MEKKNIAIIGSCVSRTMMNCYLIKNVFNITTYFFQPCVWDLFGERFDISKEEIYSLKTEDFSARTLWYNLTGSALEEIEQNMPEYIIIDIDNIRCNPYKLTFNNTNIYCQGTGTNFSKFINIIQNSNNEKLKKIDFQLLSIDEINEDIILSGLDKFVNWLKQHFCDNKIILNHTQFSRSYFDIDSNLKKYNNQKDLDKIQIKHDKYFNYLKSQLPNAIVLKETENVYSVYGDYDIYTTTNPPFDHFVINYYYKKAKYLLECLNINHKDYFSNCLDPIQMDLVLQQNKYAKLNQRLKYMQSFALNLNSYCDKIENINDFIIVISTKGNCSNNIKYFRRKSLFKLKMEIQSQYCYVAISDPKSKFSNEVTNEFSAECSYNLNNNNIFVSSKKHDYDWLSSIKINNSEFSFNEQGLNIAFINRETFDVVDTINCNLIHNSDLLVTSKFFNSIKIRAK